MLVTLQRLENSNMDFLSLLTCWRDNVTVDVTSSVGGDLGVHCQGTRVELALIATN